VHTERSRRDKLEAAVAYNKFMGGVDHCDQLPIILHLPAQVPQMVQKAGNPYTSNHAGKQLYFVHHVHWQQEELIRL
jgi:hypothetical protein